MTQWIITSSLLILAVLLIRALGRDRLSARLRYALWGLVLLRLLMPFSIGESALSIRNWLPETQTAQVQTQPILIDDLMETTQQNQGVVMPAIPITEGESSRTSVSLLAVVWAVGFLLTGAVFVICNLRFALQLRHDRKEMMHHFVPVYLTDAVETPCLFGAIRPAIYITPEVCRDETALRHVLTHELTHYQHKDHIWSILRCVCVTLHWYNPLVWVAAIASQKDAELACDEGTLARLGVQERTDYAKTLLDLTCVGYKGMLTTATSMTGNESDLKTRVLRIVKNPKMSVAAGAAVLLIAAVAALAVFTGALSPKVAGLWRLELSYLGVGVDDPASAYMEYEFFESRGVRTDHIGGEIRSAEWFSYTVDGDILRLWFDGAEAAEPFKFEVTKDTLILSQAKRELIMTRIERAEQPYLPEGARSVYNLRRIPANDDNERQAELNGTQQAQLLQLLQSGTVVETRKEVASNLGHPLFHFTVENRSGYTHLSVAGGLLYDNDKETGYVVSNITEIEAWLEALDWRSLTSHTINGIMVDGFPVVDAVNIAWGTPRYNYTVPSNQDAWRAAVDAARAAGVPDGSNQNIFEGMTFGLYVDGQHWYFDTDGTAYIAGAELYIAPKDTDAIMQLLQPYVDLIFPDIGATLPYAGTTHYIKVEESSGTTIRFVDGETMERLGELILSGADTPAYSGSSIEYTAKLYRLFSSRLGIDGDDIYVSDRGELVVDWDMHCALSNSAEVLVLLEQMMTATDTETIVTASGEGVQTEGFEPSELQGITSAWLRIYDRVFPADPAQLGFLEELLSTAEPMGYPTACPFNGLLGVTLAEGRELGVVPALDSCSAFMIGDVCYEYGNQFAYDDEGSYDNTELLAVFGLTPETLMEFIEANLPTTEGEVIGTNADIGDVVRVQNDVMEPAYLSDDIRETMISLLAQGIGEEVKEELLYDTTYYTIISSGQDTEDGVVLLSDKGILSMDGVAYELRTANELLRLLDAQFGIRIAHDGAAIESDWIGIVGEDVYLELQGVMENGEVTWSSSDEAVCTVEGDAYGATMIFTGTGEAKIAVEWQSPWNTKGYTFIVRCE